IVEGYAKERRAVANVSGQKSYAITYIYDVKMGRQVPHLRPEGQEGHDQGGNMIAGAGLVGPDAVLHQHRQSVAHRSLVCPQNTRKRGRPVQQGACGMAETHAGGSAAASASNAPHLTVSAMRISPGNALCDSQFDTSPKVCIRGRARNV